MRLSHGCGLFAALSFFACGSNDSGANAATSDAGTTADAGSSDSSTGSDQSADVAAEAAAPDVSCNALCDAVTTSCAGQLQQYASKAECLHECMDMTPGYYADANDTVGCRQAHAAAAVSNASAECPAAGPFGAGKCGDRCNSFCTLAVERCSGAGEIYGSKATCSFECGSRYKFDSNAAEYTDSGNTLNCRMHYLLDALSNADAGADSACLNAGPNSTACR